MSGEEESELKDLVVQTLENNGVLAQIRSQPQSNTEHESDYDESTRDSDTNTEKSERQPCHSSMAPSDESALYKRKRVRVQEADIDSAMMLKTGQVSVTSRLPDQYDIFGVFVASEIRHLRSDTNKKKLKRLIQRAILDVAEAEDEHLAPSNSSSNSSDGSNSYERSESSVGPCQPCVDLNYVTSIGVDADHMNEPDTSYKDERHFDYGHDL